MSHTRNEYQRDLSLSLDDLHEVIGAGGLDARQAIPVNEPKSMLSKHEQCAKETSFEDELDQLLHSPSFVVVRREQKVRATAWGEQASSSNRMFKPKEASLERPSEALNIECLEDDRADWVSTQRRQPYPDRITEHSRPAGLKSRPDTACSSQRMIDHVEQRLPSLSSKFGKPKRSIFQSAATNMLDDQSKTQLGAFGRMV